MTKINDGGPAFPVIPPCDESGISESGYPYPAQGMSLRDWFAGQALVGLIAQTMKADRAEEFARQAYVSADAMLEARKK
ncbi:hypothetical protein [Ferrovibrio sp.]|uniref:hypothetical protein n=1 Tax=Ferrovibrio sp. TaxID=1917215 RepID=UPI0035B12463